MEQLLNTIAQQKANASMKRSEVASGYPDFEHKIREDTIIHSHLLKPTHSNQNSYDTFLKDAFMEPLPVPEANLSRGVSMAFLLKFCEKFRLWEMSTREVHSQYVIPLTMEARCRLVDLPYMRDSSIGVLGPATVHVIHSWDDKFGDLVAAGTDGASDLQGSPFVWMDLFSGQSWPSSEPDRTHHGLYHCPTVLIVCSLTSEGQTENTNYNNLKSENRNHEKDEIAVKNVDKRMKVRLLGRSGCLWEVFVASVRKSVAIVVKVGHQKDRQWHSVQSNDSSLLELLSSIAFPTASTIRPSDKQLFLDRSEASGVPIEAIHEEIRRALKRAVGCLDGPEIQAAVCGDRRTLTALSPSFDSNSFKNDIMSSEMVHKIVSAGYLMNLKDIIKKERLHSTRFDGSNLLVAAARAGHAEAVDYLISQGLTDSNEGMDIEETALMIAASNGDYEILTLLLSRGQADVNARQVDGRTALMFAARGCPYNISNEKYEKEQISEASGRMESNRKYYSCLQELVRTGGHVNARRTDDFSVLMYAAKAGHAESVEFLVAKKADLNAKAITGETALTLAAEKGHVEVVRRLVELGADIRTTEEMGIRWELKEANRNDSIRQYWQLFFNVDPSRRTDGDCLSVVGSGLHRAMIAAAHGGKLPVLEYLLSISADGRTRELDHALLSTAARGERNLECLLLREHAEIEHNVNAYATACPSVVFTREKELRMKLIYV